MADHTLADMLHSVYHVVSARCKTVQSHRADDCKKQRRSGGADFNYVSYLIGMFAVPHTMIVMCV